MSAGPISRSTARCPADSAALRSSLPILVRAITAFVPLSSNSAGYRIGPAEVENVLLEHPAVRECAAVASPDRERGEVVKAFVVKCGVRIRSVIRTTCLIVRPDPYAPWVTKNVKIGRFHQSGDMISM